MIGFDHYTQAVTTWINNADHGLVHTSGTNALMIVSNGRVGALNTTAVAQERLSVPLASYSALPVGKLWFGVRLILTAWTRQIACIYVQGLAVFNTSDILATMVPGTTAYLEFSWDLATGNIDRRVNGVAISSVSAAGSRSGVVWLEGKGGGANAFYWRDIYINDDQGGTGGFLGAQVVKRIQFDAVSGTGWTTSNTNPLIGSLDLLDTTKGISGVSKDPLIASLRPDLPAGITASAIELTVAAASTIANTVACAVKLKNGSDELLGANVSGAASNVITYNNPVGVFATAPGGQPWTNAVLDVTDVILTPDV
jgi:hypothetical protein